MASANDMSLLRRFSRLHARSFLYLQRRLIKVEQELEDIDNESIKQNLGYSSLNTIEHDLFPEREPKIDEAIPLLKQYGQSRCLSDYGKELICGH